MADASSISSVAMEGGRWILPYHVIQKFYFVYYLFLISSSIIYYGDKVVNYFVDGLIYNLLAHLFVYALLLPKVPTVARFLSRISIRKYIWRAMMFVGSAIVMFVTSWAPQIFAPLIDFIKKIDAKVTPVRNNMPSGIRKPWLMIRRLLEWISSVLISPNQLTHDNVSCHHCRREESSIVLMPCRHLCLCQDCLQEIQITNLCPICQQEIKYHKTVFIF